MTAAATDEAAPPTPTSTGPAATPEAAPPPPTITTAPTTTADTTAAAGRPGPRRVKRSLATTAWPVEPSIAGGFVFTNDAMVPWVGATAFTPLLFSAGPVIAARALWSSDAGVDVVESLWGVGVGWQGRLGEARARLSIVPALMWSHAAVAGDRADALLPAVMAPLELGLPLGGGVSMSAYIEPTVAPSVTYAANGEAAYARDRLSILVGVGLDVGGPVD